MKQSTASVDTYQSNGSLENKYQGCKNNETDSGPVHGYYSYPFRLC